MGVLSINKNLVWWCLFSNIEIRRIPNTEVKRIKILPENLKTTADSQFWTREKGHVVEIALMLISQFN